MPMKMATLYSPLLTGLFLRGRSIALLVEAVVVRQPC